MNVRCRPSVQPSQRVRTGTDVKVGTCGGATAGDETAGILVIEHNKNKNTMPHFCRWRAQLTGSPARQTKRLQPSLDLPEGVLLPLVRRSAIQYI